MALEENRRGVLATLVIPNLEVRNLYQVMIERWLSGPRDFSWYDNFLSHLLNDEIEKFAEKLREVMLQIVSIHDLAKEPEAFFHGFKC